MTRAVNLASAGSIVSESVGDAPGYMARAWVNFNGTGTVAIRAAGNVSSITDNGTGDYTVNFTTAMPDANYAANLSVDEATSDSAGFANILVIKKSTTNTTSAFTIRSFYNNYTAYDPVYAMVSVFR